MSKKADNCAQKNFERPLGSQVSELRFLIAKYYPLTFLGKL